MEYLKLDEALKKLFPDLYVQVIKIKEVSVKRENPKLESYKEEVFQEIREKYRLEALKEDPIFRAYRDFFWKLGIDPTKNRPAAEALIRRILRGKPIPKINTLVDAYNLVSIKTAVPIACFDAALLEGKPFMREAKPGEKFLGIGMDKPVTLMGGEAVMQDDKRLIAIYPYRDADHSKVTEKTRNALMAICGAPGITKETLNNAASLAEEIIPRFCGGKVE